MYAAIVARAKSAPCAGYGERHPRRELVEVGPEMVPVGFGVAEGERYCPACARNVGIA